MRIIITFLFCFSTPLFLFSQNNNLKQSPRQSLEKYHQIYQFSADQQEQFLQLQQVFSEKEAALENLKTKNFDHYIAKRYQLKKMTERSLLRFLDKKQQAIFNKQQELQRQKESALKAKLKKEGISETEIRRALLELE